MEEMQLNITGSPMWYAPCLTLVCIIWFLFKFLTHVWNLFQVGSDFPPTLQRKSPQIRSVLRSIHGLNLLTEVPALVIYTAQ